MTDQPTPPITGTGRSLRTLADTGSRVQPTPRAPEPLTSIDDLAEHLGYGELPLPASEPSPPDDLREKIAEAAYTTADEYRRTPLPKKNDHELAARITAAVMDVLRREGLVP